MININNNIFFYYSDHLGSAAYLTNDAGNVTQTLNYLPYGEDWGDVQNQIETRYPRLGICTFNGKEKDYESGLHYYGARYYDCELLTGWLSVDPMADKYPSLSPYNYCAWNPVKLVDPDGRELWHPDKNHNLIADTYDNANTLATYLNTTTETAQKILNEQGLNTNVRKGDVLEVDYNGRECSNSLRFVGLGGIIIGQFVSGIAQELFYHYWNGGGDIKLSDRQFLGILIFAKEHPEAVDEQRNSINLYIGGTNYATSFGRAELISNNSGEYIGFHDEYDFDPKPVNNRTMKNELRTRLVHLASFFSMANDFNIDY